MKRDNGDGALPKEVLRSIVGGARPAGARDLTPDVAAALTAGSDEGAAKVSVTAAMPAAKMAAGISEPAAVAKPDGSHHAERPEDLVKALLEQAPKDNPEELQRWIEKQMPQIMKLRADMQADHPQPDMKQRAQEKQAWASYATLAATFASVMMPALVSQAKLSAAKAAGPGDAKIDSGPAAPKNAEPGRIEGLLGAFDAAPPEMLLPDVGIKTLKPWQGDPEKLLSAQLKMSKALVAVTTTTSLISSTAGATKEMGRNLNKH